MRIRNRIAGIISVICILLNMSVAFAAQHEINYIKSLNGDYINVSGTVTNGANKEVLLRIEYASVPSTTQELENYVVYQKQTTTDKNGGFEFKVKLKEIGNDEYTLRLGVLGDTNDVSENFIFYGENYRNQALSAIQTAQNNKDADALASAIKTYYPNLYLNTPIFGAYFKNDADMLETKALLVNYPLIENITMLEESLECVVIDSALKKTADYEGMEKEFATYDEKLDILNSTIYKTTYSALSKTLKEKVYSNFVNKPFYTPPSIKDEFTLSVLNTYLANAFGADSVKKVLGDNEDLLGIDMTDYDISDEKFLELIGGNFAKLDDVKSKLDTLKNPAGGSDGSGTGSGNTGNTGNDKNEDKDKGNSSGTTVIPSTGLDSVTGDLSSKAYPFNDMESHTWAKEATLALYESGVLNGVGEGRFSPERVITREEFLKLIVNGFGITAPVDNDVAFGDVNKNHWYYPFVKTGVNSGIINGMSANSFGVGKQISRQDMVVMIYRAMSMKMEMDASGGLSGFEDFDSIGDYAKDAVLFAEANSIVNGMGDGNFHPQNKATRAEAAVILYRAVEYLSINN